MVIKAFLENEPALKRFLRRFLVRRQDIEDITQETFAKAFAAEANQQVDQPRAFLFRIAHNLAVDAWAKKSRVATVPLEDFAQREVLGNVWLDTTQAQLEARDMLLLLEAAVAQLPDQCRRVFVMQRIYGYSHKEIAQCVGIAQSTVEKHIAAGLLKCSQYLRRHGCEAEAGRLRLKKVSRVRESANAKFSEGGVND